jgi:hypothetical protein
MAGLSFRIILAVAVLALASTGLAGCNANQGVNVSSPRPPKSSPVATWTTILMIPLATHKTKPEGVVAAAAAVEAVARRELGCVRQRPGVIPCPTLAAPILSGRGPIMDGRAVECGHAAGERLAGG